jgi:hypothetical protein
MRCEVASLAPLHLHPILNLDLRASVHRRHLDIPLTTVRDNDSVLPALRSSIDTPIGLINMLACPRPI